MKLGVGLPGYFGGAVEPATVIDWARGRTRPGSTAWPCTTVAAVGQALDAHRATGLDVLYLFPVIPALAQLDRWVTEFLPRLAPRHHAEAEPASRATRRPPAPPGPSPPRPRARWSPDVRGQVPVPSRGRRAVAPLHRRV